MFAQCRNVKISGGTFCLYQESDSSCSHSRFPGELPPLSQSFHSIRLGDLNLLLEKGKEELVEYHDVRRFKTNALVRRERVVVGVRRIYEASVFGTPGTLTAVIYKGTDFEKWKSEAEKHEAFRHPSLVQLYAVTMSQSMNALGLIYTERLIPLSEVRELHERSPLASAYVEYGIKRDLCVAFEYWQDITGTWLPSPGAPNYTSWIRASTGRLCIDVGDSFSDIKHLDIMSLVRNPISRASSIGYFEANLDLKLTSRLQLDDIHVLLSSRSGYETTEVTFRTGHVALGTIWASSDLTKVIPFSGLLSLPTILAPKDIVRQPWWYWENGHRTPCSREDVMPGGWTRITLPPNLQKVFHLTTRVKIQTSTRCEMLKCWLTQANSIARKHGGEICSLPVVGMNMISAVSSYWIPGGVKFRISIYPEDCCTLRGTFMADTPTSDIYLFLFKPEVEFVEGYPIIKIPARREALYWSFDPQGRERLSSQMAEEIGVPYVFFDSWVTGLSWAQREYDILAEFHSAKGFDPFTRQVALQLGHPLVGPPTASHTSLSEVDEIEVEYAKRELKTYPKQGFRRAAVKCEHCGKGRPVVQNVVLPDVEVPPIHRHRTEYRSVFVLADTTLDTTLPA